MEYNKYIADMNTGDEAEGFYILKDAGIKSTAAGKPFMTGTIADKTGSMELKVWDYSGPLGASDAGKVIKLRGEIGEYKGSLQFSAQRIRLADGNDTYSASDLVPVAPIDAEAAYAEVKALIESISDSEYRSVCEEMLRLHSESFRKIPAAKSVHHSFLNGLLMHTSSMMTVADFLADRYHEVIDRNLLIAGAFLHDLAKETEFAFSELGTVKEYSVKGQLLGHLVMGASEIASVCERLKISDEKSMLLQHLVLSHHGQPEFGAAVVPTVAEAELLSYIDLIDSRMEIYAEAVDGLETGSFTDRIFALDNRRIYKHTMSD